MQIQSKTLFLLGWRIAITALIQAFIITISLQGSYPETYNQQRFIWEPCNYALWRKCQLNLLNNYFNIKSKYKYRNIFPLEPNFKTLRNFSLARIVIFLFSFPVTLMTSFTVLLGTLDVLQVLHTFYLLFSSGLIYYIIRVFLIWLKSLFLFTVVPIFSPLFSSASIIPHPWLSKSFPTLLSITVAPLYMLLD